MARLNSSTKSDPTVAIKPAEPANQSPSQTVQSDELLTVAEVANYLKFSRRTAWRWCKNGQLPAVKVGHQWRVARSDLEDFVRRRGKMVL